MHRLSAAARRSLVVALGSLTALFVVLNFGVFLNALSSPQSEQKAERAEVFVLDEANATELSEAERQHIEAQMARIEVEMQRLDKELRSLEMDHVHRALDAARDAMTRKEMRLKPPTLPTTLTREGTFPFQFDASEVQLN